MKANELMIGDWVYMEANSGYKAQYIQVETIPDASSKDHYGHIGAFPVGGDNDFRDIEDRHLSPVPLTPEILEKNKLNERVDFKLDFSRIHRLKITLIWVDANGNSKPQITYYLPKPIYVHELQHALRICGIDKEIEL